MVLVVEHNRTWQMTARVCFDIAKIVHHLQGAFCNKLLMPLLPVRKHGRNCYIECLISTGPPIILSLEMLNRKAFQPRKQIRYDVM